MNYLSFLEENLQASAKIALRYYGHVSSTVKQGDNNQVLTEADLEIGRKLVMAVQAVYPDHNVIDEEAGVIDKNSHFTWVIDPIDATSNFAAGILEYGIMIGLLEDSTPIAGGVIVPAHNRLYLAEKGKGATCNGQPIHVMHETHLSNVLVSYGIDGHQENPGQTVRECRMLADIVLASRNIRNSDCEAVDPMFVADGRFGGRINMSSKIWDNVGPQIIAEEAGAIWTDAYGSPIDYSHPATKADLNFTFCVASPALHRQLVAITNNYK